VKVHQHQWMHQARLPFRLACQERIDPVKVHQHLVWKVEQTGEAFHSHPRISSKGKV
jgi:hypothetical protein